MLRLFVQDDGGLDFVHVALLLVTIVGSALVCWRVMHEGDQFDAYSFFLGGGLLWSMGSGATTLRDRLLGNAPGPERKDHA